LAKTDEHGRRKPRFAGDRADAAHNCSPRRTLARPRIAAGSGQDSCERAAPELAYRMRAGGVSTLAAGFQAMRRQIASDVPGARELICWPAGQTTDLVD